MVFPLLSSLQKSQPNIPAASTPNGTPTPNPIFVPSSGPGHADGVEDAVATDDMADATVTTVPVDVYCATAAAEIFLTRWSSPGLNAWPVTPSVNFEGQHDSPFA